MPQKDWHDPLAGPNRSSVAALVGPAPRQFAIFELRTKKLLKNGDPRWYRVVPGVKGLLSNTVPSMTFEHSHFSITFEHSLLHHVRKRPSPTEIIDRRNTLKTRAFKSDAW